MSRHRGSRFPILTMTIIWAMRAETGGGWPLQVEDPRSDARLLHVANNSRPSETATRVVDGTSRGSGGRGGVVGEPFERMPPSPADLLKPDGFQFYTYNEQGDMITRRMTMQEIQALIAGGGPERAGVETEEVEKAEDILTGGKKVMDVVNKVQSVLKSALGRPPSMGGSLPTVPEQASAEWSSILPVILAGEPERAPGVGGVGNSPEESSSSEGPGTKIPNSESTGLSVSMADSTEMAYTEKPMILVPVMTAATTKEEERERPHESEGWAVDSIDRRTSERPTAGVSEGEKSGDASTKVDGGGSDGGAETIGEGTKFPWLVSQTTTTTTARTRTTGSNDGSTIVFLRPTPVEMTSEEEVVGSWTDFAGEIPRETSTLTLVEKKKSSSSTERIPEGNWSMPLAVEEPKVPSSSEYQGSDLPTALVDSLSSVIGQVSEGIPSALPVPHQGAYDPASETFTSTTTRRSWVESATQVEEGEEEEEGNKEKTSSPVTYSEDTSTVEHGIDGGAEVATKRWEGSVTVFPPGTSEGKETTGTLGEEKATLGGLWLTTREESKVEADTTASWTTRPDETGDEKTTRREDVYAMVADSKLHSVADQQSTAQSFTEMEESGRTTTTTTTTGKPSSANDSRLSQASPEAGETSETKTDAYNLVASVEQMLQTISVDGGSTTWTESPSLPNGFENLPANNAASGLIAGFPSSAMPESTYTDFGEKNWSTEEESATYVSDHPAGMEVTKDNGDGAVWTLQGILGTAEGSTEGPRGTKGGTTAKEEANIPETVSEAMNSRTDIGVATTTFVQIGALMRNESEAAETTTTSSSSTEKEEAEQSSTPVVEKPPRVQVEEDAVSCLETVQEYTEATSSTPTVAAVVVVETVPVTRRTVTTEEESAWSEVEQQTEGRPSEPLSVSWRRTTTTTTSATMDRSEGTRVGSPSEDVAEKGGTTATAGVVAVTTIPVDGATGSTKMWSEMAVEIEEEGERSKTTTTTTTRTTSTVTTAKGETEKKESEWTLISQVPPISLPKSEGSLATKGDDAAVSSGVVGAETTSPWPSSPAEEVSTETTTTTTTTTTQKLREGEGEGEGEAGGDGLSASTARTSEDVRKFAELCNTLAFRFWTAANKGLSTARSLALSPFGMTSLLSMLYLGARGSTSDQMNEVLGLDNVATFNPHLIFQNITDGVGLARQRPEEGISNAAFARELFADKGRARKLMPFYKEQAQQFYEGLVAEVNFATIGDLVRRRTNLMVRKQTGGRIKELVKSNAVAPRSPLAAISANVFETDCSNSAEGARVVVGAGGAAGSSSSSSSSSSTVGGVSSRDGELYFAVSPGETTRPRRLIPVPATVWRSSVLAGYEPSMDATAVAIGGGTKLVSTIFLLPGQQGHVAPGDTLDRLEERLARGVVRGEGTWDKLLRVIRARPGLEVQVPKFSHRSIVNATAALKRMGLERLFSGQADFRGINGGGGNRLHLSDVLQMNLFSTCGEESVAGGRHHVETYPSSPPGRKARGQRRQGRGRSRRRRWTIGVGERTLSRRKDDDFAAGIRKGSPGEGVGGESVTESTRTTTRRGRVSEKKPLRLRLDQPFLYFVRHNPTGFILHMGRFNPRLTT